MSSLINSFRLTLAINRQPDSLQPLVLRSISQEALTKRTWGPSNLTAASPDAIAKLQHAEDVKYLKNLPVYLGKLQEIGEDYEGMEKTKREILTSLEEVVTVDAATANGRLHVAHDLVAILEWYIDGAMIDRDVGAKGRGDFEHAGAVLCKQDRLFMTGFLVGQALKAMSQKLVESEKRVRALQASKEH
ncbi:hypothetical protein GQX73_g10774 [Xylaria multiplex]|uniref:Uncharacterized protein n=1 Tax=Xylaria multiplex TaxID=323545 RepID=A0A7C8MWM7_9PEZI|nr:hypothetical protein GQX73_g10774 [Xylaria multiplex]